MGDARAPYVPYERRTCEYGLLTEQEKKNGPRKILLDCGANVASTVQLFRETYPGGRDYTIHSFELDSRLAPYFASYSDHVLHCPVAVAGKDAGITFETGPARHVLSVDAGGRHEAERALSGSQAVVTRLDQLLHFGRAATGSLTGSRGYLAGNITAYAETAWRPDKGKVAGADMQWGGGSIYVWEAEKKNGNIGRHLAQEDYVIFKIDVEGAEYEILEKMLKEGTFKWIDKVYGEFHGWQLVTDWPKERKQGLQDALNASGITMLDWVGERKTYEDMETLCPVDISEDTPGAAGGFYSNCTRSPGGPARLALTVQVGMNRSVHKLSQNVYPDGTGRNEQVSTQVITKLTLTVQVGTQVITELTLTVQVGTQVITELTLTVQVGMHTSVGMNRSVHRLSQNLHDGTGRDKQVGTQVITELTLTVQVGTQVITELTLTVQVGTQVITELTLTVQVGTQVITELTLTVQVGMNRTYPDGTGRDEQVGTQVITERTPTVQVGMNRAYLDGTGRYTSYHRTYPDGTGRDEQVSTQVITERTLTVQVGMKRSECTRRYTRYHRTYPDGTGRDEQVGTQVITELTMTVQVGAHVITELTLTVQVGMNRKAAHKLVETIRAHHSNMPVTLFVYGDFVQEYPDLVTQWAQRYTIGMRENAPFPEDRWDLQNTNVVRMGMISAVQRMREVGLQPAYFYPSSLSKQVKNEASRRGLRIIQSTTKFPPNIGTLLTEKNYYRFRDVERTPKALRILHERISYGGILTLDSDHPDSYMISAFLMDYLYENSGFELVSIDNCLK
ncbi:hypothetical protein Bbelb_192980 [Branchiostoma belcheri]|nr:hypothetical protein Bbelb_192980 [Branchiostoma belcheri]